MCYCYATCYFQASSFQDPTRESARSVAGLSSTRDLVGVPGFRMCTVFGGVGRQSSWQVRPLSPPHLQLSISDLFTWSPKSLSWKIFLQRVSDREESLPLTAPRQSYLFNLFINLQRWRARPFVDICISLSLGDRGSFNVKRCHELTISRIPWIYAWAGCTKSPKTQVRERCSTIWRGWGFRGLPQLLSDCF